MPSRTDATQVRLAGVGFSALHEDDVVDRVTSGTRGGWVVTPNLDILRMVDGDDQMRALVDAATLVVADGMPLLWASRLRGTPLPERIAGSSLVITISQQAARRGRSVYFIGGAPGVARRAGMVLAARFPGLVVAGDDCPPLGFESTPDGVTRIRDALCAAAPDIVFCGLGFPKQERLIAQLRPALPHAWFVGCGAGIPFAAGAVARAPAWMQRWGLEWMHRLGAEPRRLFRRYVVDGIPYAIRLLVVSAWAGRSRRTGSGRPARSGESGVDADSVSSGTDAPT